MKTEKPNSVCKCGCPLASHCFSDGTFKPYCDGCPCKAFEPVAEPAEPSASPEIESKLTPKERRENNARIARLWRGEGDPDSAAPQPVAGEGPPKFFDGELIPIHWCPGLKKFVLYPSLFCLKHNRGSGEVDYVPVISEGTPKLEEIAVKYIDDPAWREKFLMHDAKAALVEFANAILRPFITPACSPQTESDLERQLAICEQNGTKWAHFKVADIRALMATPASTGEANGKNNE